MRKHLVPVGNSLALIIDKPILELLQMDRESTVELRVEGDKLIVSSAGRGARKARIKEIAKQVYDGHASTMSKLAK